MRRNMLNVNCVSSLLLKYCWQYFVFFGFAEHVPLHIVFVIYLLFLMLLNLEYFDEFKKNPQPGKAFRCVQLFLKVYFADRRTEMTTFIIAFCSAFAKYAKRHCWHRHVCPSSCPHQIIRSRWTNFHDIGYLRIFAKSAEKIQILLKFDNNGDIV